MNLVKFSIDEQTKELHHLKSILFSIQTCESAFDIDPTYYGEKKIEYVNAYITEVGKLNTALQTFKNAE